MKRDKKLARNEALIKKTRNTSAALLETIDLLEGRISKRQFLILNAAYLILRWIGVWGLRSR